MEHVRWASEPSLREPVLVCAFGGWNDAGDAATTALRHLAESWNARSFASIDAEEFFDFSTVRPQVRLNDGVTREVFWPHAEFMACSSVGGSRDAVLLLGIEPQLRWRTYCEQIVGVAQKLRVSLIVTLGALLADVPHTRAVNIIGTAVDPSLIDRYDLQRSQYEGPTGIVGVVQDACNRAKLPALSFWAAVPGYAPQTPSPKAALALVQRLCSVLGAKVAVGGLQQASVEYERELDEHVAGDDDLAGYVSRLETMVDSGFDEDRDDDDDEDDEDPAVSTVDPASADRLVAELEQFLREQGRDG